MGHLYPTFFFSPNEFYYKSIIFFSSYTYTLSLSFDPKFSNNHSTYFSFIIISHFISIQLNSFHFLILHIPIIFFLTIRFNTKSIIIFFFFLHIFLFLSFIFLLKLFH